MRDLGTARAATSESFDLAEGPFWDVRDGALSWVDITQGHVYRGRLGAGGTIRIDERLAFDAQVGAASPGTRGDVALALGGAIVRRAADGALTTLAVVAPMDEVVGAAQRRLNDGMPDPAGRFVVGTLHKGESDTPEVLVRLEPDGTLTTIDDDLGLSNGLAWTADGSVMYSVDTTRRVVYRRSYPELGPREVHIELNDGYPDGICLDADDHLWVAVWGAGEVRRFDPGGALVGVVSVPAPHTSSVAFAGPDLATLVITTARSELSEQQIADWPDSGRLFTFEPGVRGLPATPWGGASIAEESEGRS
ncbi:hypothetical protein GCM10009775_08740 [Microbacterium aoyamense]|uniref:SMP-30/Gluconolactonase/LRE-like region domain-containing protein n=1 Tax=Microbacterium aoyamense TaxID=344166 RepID=A0ABN2PCW8_9MICO|nr:SMP-30/gluconolactonase/LRE family protein [Microbacterium aoyamense]